MKKFAKLAAVFAALVLAWACFVACSNGDDDSGSDSASVQALQGLWIEEGYDWGSYFVDNTMYEALFDKKEGKYYFDKEYGCKFSVSGNKIITYYYDKDCEDEGYFEINGDTLTEKYVYKDKDDGSLKNGTNIYKKIVATPIGISHDAFNERGNSLFDDSEE